MISSNYNKTVDIQRLTDGDGNFEEYDDHIDDLACMIQPLDDSFSEDIDGNFGKSWLMFCSVQDILEGDRVVYGDTQYKVVGVESHSFLGQSRHMEVTIRESNI